MKLGRRIPQFVVAAIAIPVVAAVAASAIPLMWTAGGLDAGTTGAGQAGRMASDTAGNVAIVSGPAGGRDLAVTSHTAAGTFRWRSTVSPTIGTFIGDWVAASPDGDFVAVGRNVNSGGAPIGITLVRYASDGTLRWRRDVAGVRPGVGRLLVDAAGAAYLAFNAVGDGQDIGLQKFDPAGVLLWSQVISTGLLANDVATSLALSPDGADVVLAGNIVGGATWIVASYNVVTGARRWLVTAAEGTTARDVVVDATRVYVTGQGVTGAGTPAITYWLTAVGYDRATGARLWRRDVKPADAGSAAGLWIALAPDGSLVTTGQAARGFLDWFTVALDTTGTIRWQAVRDGGLNTNEVPAAVTVLPDGTTVVTGAGGPNLPGGFIPGVIVGYGPDGALLWEAFARMATVWESALVTGDVCATGGYDALVTCWRPSGGGANARPSAAMTAIPSSGVAPLTVAFDGSRSSDSDGTVASWVWSFGDGAVGSGAVTAHAYTVPGSYTASLTVSDNGGASSTATASIKVYGAPEAPAGLAALTISRQSIGLTWTNGTIPQTGVRVERCTGSACTNFAEVAALPGTATSFTDGLLARRTTYRYRVRAHNTFGSSPYSNTASARTNR